MSSEPNKPAESTPADPPRDETPARDETTPRGESPVSDPDREQPAADRSAAAGGDDEGGTRGQLSAEEPPAEEPGDMAETLETASEDTAAGAQEDDEQDDDEDVQPIESLIEEEPGEEEPDFHWYILKVQVNREDSIRDALIRRVKIEGLEELFKEIVVPTEDVAEFNKAGKRRIVKKKLYPGYIMVNMAINDDTWFLVRETPGIGDFTGSAGRPTPMDPNEVDRILARGKTEEGEEGHVKTSIPFKPGDQVRVKDGNFQGFEGDVDAIDEAHGRVTVMINIFGRPTPVELEHWQIEAV